MKNMPVLVIIDDSIDLNEAIYSGILYEETKCLCTVEVSESRKALQELLFLDELFGGEIQNDAGRMFPLFMTGIPHHNSAEEILLLDRKADVPMYIALGFPRREFIGYFGGDRIPSAGRMIQMESHIAEEMMPLLCVGEPISHDIGIGGRCYKQTLRDMFEILDISEILAEERRPSIFELAASQMEDIRREAALALLGDPKPPWERKRKKLKIPPKSLKIKNKSLYRQ